jgi:hypothetical protein
MPRVSIRQKGGWSNFDTLGMPKLGIYPSLSKVDKNDITGRCVRRTRLAD